MEMNKQETLWRQAVNDSLLRRVKMIGENEQIYTGYPTQLMNEIIEMHRKIMKSRRRETARNWARKNRAQSKAGVTHEEPRTIKKYGEFFEESNERTATK